MNLFYSHLNTVKGFNNIINQTQQSYICEGLDSKVVESHVRGVQVTKSVKG